MSAIAGRLGAAPGCGSDRLLTLGRYSRERCTPTVRGFCDVPGEPIRVGEGPGIAANDNPVRSGAVRRDVGVLGQGATAVERQLDVRRSELDVLAAKAPLQRQAAVEIELLARGNVRDSQQEHDLVDLPSGRAGVLLRRRRDLPDRPIWCTDDAAVTPESLFGGL